MKPTNQGIIFIVVSSLMFGTYGLWSKLIGDSFGSFFQGYSRAVIIVLVLLPLLLWKKQIVPIHRNDLFYLAVFLLFTSLTQAPIFYAFNHMDIGSATLLFFVSMLLTMYAVGFLFLGEKLSWIKSASFIIAAIGLYLVFSFSLAAFSLFAALMAIINGIASGGEVSFSKKLTGNYSPLYLTWLSWIIIVITNAPLSILLGETQHLPSLETVWLYQLGFTVCSLLAFWLIIKGLQSTEASIGGLLGLLEIIFSITLGILFFSEQLSFRVALGGMLILVAAALPHVISLFENKQVSL
jgi:drug/metabolite transporter (DMT)-like permease